MKSMLGANGDNVQAGRSVIERLQSDGTAMMLRFV
jgi:hypothetical protein